MKNKIIYTVLAIVIIALVIFNVTTVRKVSRRAAPIAPPVLNEAPVRVYGVVEPVGKPITLHPNVPGVVKSVLVSDGDTVKAGQTICELENSVALAQLEAAKARLEIGRKSAELSRDEYRRNVALRADGSISEADYVRLKLKKELEEEQTDLYVKEIALARARLEELSIRSPIDGIVYYCDIRPGEYFGPGEEDHIVIGSKKLQIRCDVEVIWIDKVLPGRTFEVVNSETGDVIGKASWSAASRYLRSKRITTEDPGERMSAKYQEVIMSFEPDDPKVPIELPVMVRIAD